jgi:Na+/H+ antiporter NhaA
MRSVGASIGVVLALAMGRSGVREAVVIGVVLALAISRSE